MGQYAVQLGAQLAQPQSYNSLHDYITDPAMLELTHSLLMKCVGSSLSDAMRNIEAWYNETGTSFILTRPSAI